mmetsp:Transcript_84140/g.154336  ORF Transcript_84140/g.154336 Transcript_84140/m.154336 type:complete len:145 (-) Transcript_84140:63-497(-)
MTLYDGLFCYGSFGRKVHLDGLLEKATRQGTAHIGSALLNYYQQSSCLFFLFSLPHGNEHYGGEFNNPLLLGGMKPLRHAKRLQVCGRRCHELDPCCRLQFGPSSRGLNFYQVRLAHRGIEALSMTWMCMLSVHVRVTSDSLAL